MYQYMLIVLNMVSGLFLFKLIKISQKIEYELKEKDKYIYYLLHKCNDLQNEIIDIYESLDSIDENLYKKNIDLRQSNEQIINKIDKFIISNYETI